MKISKEKAIETTLVFSSILVIIYLISDIKLLLYISLGFAVIGLLFPGIAKAYSWVWLEFSKLLGKVVSTLVMGVVFFLFLVPIAFLYRLFNKDMLKTGKPKNQTIYIPRNILFTSQDMENIW